MQFKSVGARHTIAPHTGCEFALEADDVGSIPTGAANLTIASWSNGRVLDSESEGVGSIPTGAAKQYIHRLIWCRSSVPHAEDTGSNPVGCTKNNGLNVEATRDPDSVRGPDDRYKSG